MVMGIAISDKVTMPKPPSYDTRLLREGRIAEFNERVARLPRDYRIFLHGADLRGLDLRGANLEAAFLGTADLSHSDLRGCNLTDTVLIETNLAFSDLRETTGLEQCRLRLAIGVKFALLPADIPERLSWRTPF